MEYIIYSIASIVMFLVLFLATRNLLQYDCRGVIKIPLKFTLWVYIGIFLLMFIPLFNIIFFIIILMYINVKILEGIEERHSGWYVQQNKRNLIVKILQILNKKY